MAQAIIYEQGNGLPVAGDYASDGDQLYLIESIDSRIQTDSPRGNYVYATVEPVEPVEWDECDESDEHSALVELTDDEPDDGYGPDRDDYVDTRS